MSGSGWVRAMRRKLAYLFLVFGLGWLYIGSTLSAVLADGGHVAVITIDGAIDPISAGYLARGIDEAASDGAQLVVIKLDTPGGLLSSTREMVEAILGAEIPVAVYVSPPGARAASAGTFITAAAHFAVMAPGTNIGAASPVASGGEDLPETLARKVNEDTRAFMRSIADQRNRNAEALEETVTLARSYSATEAVNRNVVDFIARDLEDMLAQLDGQTAETSAGTVVLQTRGVTVKETRRTLLERLLDVVADPNLAFLLVSIGGLAIMVELWSPGFVGPGVVGIIALALGLLGMGNLPVNWIAVGLILFAVILFFLEMQEPGLGIFGVGSAIGFVLGAFLLFGNYFSTPEIPGGSMRVSLWIISTFGGGLLAFTLFFVYLARSTGSSTGYVTASEGVLLGQTGIAVSDLEPSGRIRLADEERTATTNPGDVIRQGEEVTVLGVYGNVLKVSRVPPEDVGEKRSLLGRLFGRRRGH